MMTMSEIRTLPIGTLVESGMGTIYRVESVTKTHIVLTNTQVREGYTPPNIAIEAETSKLTLLQASRLLITD